MKIEKLRKNHKKEIMIGVVAICIVGGALTFNLTKAKYKLTENIPLARGTVNYKALDFKVMAMYQQKEGSTCTTVGSCYNEITGRMPSSGYEINTTNSYCTLNGSKDTSAVLKTVDGNHVMGNLANGEKCFLYFDKKRTITIGNVEIEFKDEKPDFSKAATTDEGVFKVEDGMYGGYSYYWRGAVTNNYVKFAGKCWRIVRINGDGTIRLIYDGSICHANGTITTESIAVTNQSYNDNRISKEYVGWSYSVGSQRPSNIATSTASNGKTQTENWYASNIGNNTTYASKVADGKYCNDRDIASSSGIVEFAGHDRSGAKSSTIVNPTLSCPSGDVYTLKAGAITMDEVVMAGTKWVTSNTSNYLYNGNKYWTMTPARFWASYARVFYIKVDGGVDYENVAVTSIGFRPIINLKSDTKFSSGNGTQSNPFIVQ